MTNLRSSNKKSSRQFPIAKLEKESLEKMGKKSDQKRNYLIDQIGSLDKIKI